MTVSGDSQKARPVNLVLSKVDQIRSRVRVGTTRSGGDLGLKARTLITPVESGG